MNLEKRLHYIKKFNINVKAGEDCIKRETFKTTYGYKIEVMTKRIATITTKLQINEDKTARAVTKIQPILKKAYQVTTYFDKKGLEIIAGNTRSCLSEYKRIRK